MTTLTVSVPLPTDLDIDAQTAKELLILSLVDSGRLSQSQATDSLWISRYDLIELMGKYEVPVMHYGAGDLAKERAVVSRYPHKP